MTSPDGHRGREPLQTLARIGLGGLLAFGGINALGGGIYGLSGAKDIPLEWLAGSPFTSYFIPSLILVVVVGGSLLAAAIAVFARARIARLLAFGAGSILLGWIAVQVAIIGYVSWLQPAVTVAGLVVLALAWSLSGFQAAKKRPMGERRPRRRGLRA